MPGLDSQEAVDLLERAGSDDAGVTAQIVISPQDPGATFGTPALAAELAAVHDRIAGLAHVVAVTDPATAVSPDGRVALTRVQYLSLDGGQTIAPTSPA